MDTYKKPFIKNNCENLKHPYPRSMFKEYDIFPLIILDGGGFFFLKDHFGNESILEGIKSGKLFDLWRNEGKIDWKLPMKMHEKAEFKPWEHMVWINRLYFLLPIAQEFYRTGNEEWADLWYKYFSQWNEDNPYEPYDKRHYLDANLIWRDMQVCWRLLVLIHSVYLLEGSKALDGQKWESIYRSIEVHAGHIHREALDHLVSGRVGGNHYQQKGLALLYAGVLFPEFGMSEQYINAGKEIILNHFRDQIFSDGGSVEGSPSYSHFIARIYVEAFLLLKKNGLEEIEGLEEGIQKQYEWLYQASSPTGHSLQISDSYALNTGLDFEIVSKIFPLELSKEKKSVFFKESGLIIFRNQKLEIFVDAMKQTQYHQHFGRPNILIYLNNLPLIIDSGCCNYDRTVKDSFFHRAHAHNVVVIPEFEDIFDTRQKMAEHMEQHSQLNIKECIMDERRMEAVIVHSVNNHEFGYTWERIIAAEGKRIRITDRIRSDKSITCRQVFHMAPWNMLLSEDKSTAKIFAGNEVVVFEQANKNTKLYADFQPAYDFNNNMTYSQVLTSTLKGTECEFEMLIYV